jgi:acetyl-CoA C-acetyltransferase
MREVVIVSACRTPIGKFSGGFKNIDAQKLGSIVIDEAVKRSGINPKEIDEVIMGNVVSAGLGQNPARQAMIYANLPYEIPATTINKVCGSGLKAVALAADAIKTDHGDIIVAGGMENMSRAPYILRKARFGYRLFDGKLVDTMVYDGLWDVYNDFHMGNTGDIIAEKYAVTREEMDKWALRSHQMAAKATNDGKFKDEMIPVKLPLDEGEVAMDEGIRENSTYEKLAKLKPFFRKEGFVTAGNASQISDGASALVVMSKKKADDLGIKPLVSVRDYTSSGVKPELVMEAPIPAVRMLLKRTKLGIDDIDLFEHNEAFASATVAIAKELKIPHEKLNIHGGAVALGHPIGCSGARVLTTLIYAMKDRNAKRGLATLCLGGGNAVAMIVESQ